MAAQAQPDRWWFGIGRPTQPIASGAGPPAGGRAQTTQGYVWALSASLEGAGLGALFAAVFN